MDTNFIALLPSFKFERNPTFVLACDAVGLHLLCTNFHELADVELETSFVVGDGVNISSDDRCRLVVVHARDEEKSEILRLDRSNFTWRLNRTDASKIADKLRRLLTSNLPGHQYLEVERGRYRTVVVTKQEYPVDTIRAMRDGRA